MCGRVAGRRGRSVLILDHAAKPAEKIRISGGGRCNFTNLHSSPAAFLSNNRHFCKSAFTRYTQDDFVQLVTRHQIAFHEKKLGQLFCDDSAQQIIDMLLAECAGAGAELRLRTSVGGIAALPDGGYRVEASCGVVECASLVIATGGLSIPKIGATRFGYDVARQFGLEVTGLRPALVPLTFQANFLERCKALSGLSVDAEVRHGKTGFRELLFTHRGLSGPSVLQISSYWDEGEGVSIDLAPGIDIAAMLTGARAASPKREVLTELAAHLPKRLAADILDELGIGGRLADLPNKMLARLGERLNRWQVSPSGTEGYRTAEVTLGGVDVGELSSKTMEARHQPGLFFIGEVVDVTGHLGGYNFQWAWSSGFVAGEAV